MDRLRLFEMLKGAIAAAQMREAVALAEERKAEDAARGVPKGRQGNGVAGEIGLARRISPNEASRWLGAARVLQDELPATFAQLASGATSERRAVLVAKETIFLSREERALVDVELAPRLEQLGDRKVESEARRMAQRLDPAGAVDRARRAERERRVAVRPAPDTMSYVTLLLPVQKGVAAYASLRKHADSLIAVGQAGANPDGSVRTRDQLMADSAFERLTGLAPDTDVPVEIHLVMSDATLFGPGHSTEADEPGILLGHGAVPAPIARELALGRGRGEGDKVKRWIRRLYLTADGRRLAAMDSSLEAGLEAMQAQLSLLNTTADAAEGVGAFLQKRKPAWKGR